MNWVKARGDCTIRSTFQALREQVKADVEEFNGLEEAGHECALSDEGRGRDSFFVRSTGDRAVVRFEANHRCIMVAGAAEDDAFSIKLHWDDDADICRLIVDGRRTTLWQISKKALSPLFFG